MKNLAWAKAAIYDKKNCTSQFMNESNLLEPIWIAIELKIDVIFAPNLNLSLFPHYWWEFGKSRKQE